MKFTKEMEKDFDNFTDFFLEVEENFQKLYNMRENEVIPLPDRIMIGVWAAGVWFSKKQNTKKGGGK